MGLLQIESWGSDEVAVDGRALQGTEGGVALGDSWFAGATSLGRRAHYRTHRTNRTNRTGWRLPLTYGLR